MGRRAPAYEHRRGLLYPLFTDDVIRLMRQTIPPERHDHVATAVIVKARKPEAR